MRWAPSARLPIIDDKGDYILPVKGNQPMLHQEIKALRRSSGGSFGLRAVRLARAAATLWRVLHLSRSVNAHRAVAG
jgi:hypothetical protein